MKHVTIRVYGQVQGVFFRASTKGKADELGLKGRVKNEDGGTVLIEAEGPKNKLDELMSWLDEGGPPFAKVDRVDVEWGETTEPFADFRIQ